MNRCSPEEMRKNLEVVDNYRKHGIDFVAVPVRNNDHKNYLITKSLEILDSIIDGEGETPELFQGTNEAIDNLGVIK